MDSLRLLVQQVARAFYEPKFIILLDQLARNPVYVVVITIKKANWYMFAVSKMTTWPQEWVIAVALSILADGLTVRKASKLKS